MTVVKIGPGLYAEDGVLHVDVGDLLAQAGWPDTPDNRDRMADLVRVVLDEQYPGVPVEEL